MDHVKVKSEWVAPSVWFDWGDGHQFGYEQYVVTVTDLRQTPFGLVDFGYVKFGPKRPVTRKAVDE